MVSEAPEVSVTPVEATSHGTPKRKAHLPKLGDRNISADLVHARVTFYG
jgi:hypothetical protein